MGEAKKAPEGNEDSSLEMFSSSPTAADLLGGNGKFAQTVKGFRPRPGQQLMAAACEWLYANGGQLLVEGPTGVGKTLAYLVPAAIAAANYGKRTVIVAPNIALQDQLFEKDVPAVLDALELRGHVSYARLKGISNYVCDRNLNLTKADTANRKLPGMRELIRWAEKTTTGDKDELREIPSQETWGRISTDSDGCPGARKCEFSKGCHAMEARYAARSARIVVTNTSFLFAHAVVLSKTNGKTNLLGPFEALVIDEAHKVPDIARSAFGDDISFFSIRSMSKNKAVPAGIASRLLDAGKIFFDGLKKRYDANLFTPRITGTGLGGLEIDDLVGILNEVSNLEEDYGGKSPDAKLLSNVKRRAGEIAGVLIAAHELKSPTSIFHIEPRGKKKDFVALCLKEAEPANTLKALVWPLARTLIATSATLATTPGDLRFIRDQLGFSEDAHMRLIQSPFNMKRQARLIVPSAPHPNSPEFRDFTAETVLRAARLARGRTLALFTSYASMNHAYDYLMKQGFEYPLLMQGQLTRRHLIDEFRNNIASVLLATESFWQGVDIPGESLSCVIIDRLPFGQPGDPISDWFTKTYKDWFMRFTIPRAIHQFRQGAGRLIRTESDRGVVVLLDNRATEKGYGKMFLRSVGMPITDDIGQITEVLDSTTDK